MEDFKTFDINLCSLLLLNGATLKEIIPGHRHGVCTFILDINNVAEEVFVGWKERTIEANVYKLNTTNRDVRGRVRELELQTLGQKNGIL